MKKWNERSTVFATVYKLMKTIDSEKEDFSKHELLSTNSVKIVFGIQYL